MISLTNMVIQSFIIKKICHINTRRISEFKYDMLISHVCFTWKQIDIYGIKITFSYVIHLEALLKKLQLNDKPSQLYNVDETGINDHMSSREKSYAARGEQHYQKKIICNFFLTNKIAIATVSPYIYD